MNQENSFIWAASTTFSEMRLIVEGAISLFENQALILCSLARNTGHDEAQLAFDDIGTALYAFRSHIEKLRIALHQAALQDGEAKTYASADSFQEPENRGKAVKCVNNMRKRNKTTFHLQKESI